jgi:threonine synthase
MNYYSLNKNTPSVSFREAAIRGQAPDRGLYFPETIPTLSPSFLRSFKQLSKEEIGFEVMKPFVQGAIPDDILQQIVKETVSFPFPLQKITEQIQSLELFHGPTLAFKDVGARFMSRCLGYFAQEESEKITVLVATSGDTGGAVADGFYEVDGVDVVILYPTGRVSPVQEKQLTTLGKNITALEIQGNFDDCQRMVKDAFADQDLQAKLYLTSANSINVARWLPQQLYYFYALQQWQEEQAPVVSVPSGNFGNICAGMMAQQSGLPIKHFIAACNANDVVPRYLHTGYYQPEQAVATISNAMDVGSPSNFSRIQELFQKDIQEVKFMLSGYSITDEQTMETISKVWKEQQYLLDPHGAVGYRAMELYLEQFPNRKGFILETAHPIKFPEAVEKGIGKAIDYPAAIADLMKKEKNSILMEANTKQLKDYLMNR